MCVIIMVYCWFMKIMVRETIGLIRKDCGGKMLLTQNLLHFLVMVHIAVLVIIQNDLGDQLQIKAIVVVTIITIDIVLVVV